MTTSLRDLRVRLGVLLDDRPAADDALFHAMRDLSLSHAERLLELGPVRVLALDPCPNCRGTVIASDVEARCASGCGWARRRVA